MAASFYYLLGESGSRGPYRREDLMRLWEDGEISASESCVPKEGGPACSVAELLRDPLHPGPEHDEKEAFRPLLAGEPIDSGRIPMVGDTIPVREKIDDDDSDPSEVVYRGHPCILAYPRSLFLALILFMAGVYLARNGPDYWLVLGLIAALAVVLVVFLERSFRKYTVTGRRIEMHWGILARNSKEIRIRDIRAINIVRGGILGLFGVGRVEFSSAGSDGDEVAFADVWAAANVKKIVRKLQDTKEGGD